MARKYLLLFFQRRLAQEVGVLAPSTSLLCRLPPNSMPETRAHEAASIVDMKACTHLDRTKKFFASYHL